MDKKMLYKNWIHSYEEDSEYEMVFRPETFTFPLRRGGREAIDLRSDRTYIQRKSASDDSYIRDEGTWDIKGENIISVGQNPVIGSGNHQIVTLTENILVIKK